ncbi:hypothetical protein KQX54_016601 [Cotesia glomerata]|uniref:Uncharacterized protein n=1 Tax=Cotesia glomerata TaxID=32391 RepID=A0AAV7IIY3_COTGL|nr:hypothetical protein KQX54_016601 [Cotesia glomerata]
MKCYLAPPASQREFKVYFSINREPSYCVEGIDLQTYLRITSKNDQARLFLMNRIMERMIPSPDEGINLMDISENGLDFKSIDRETTNDVSEDPPDIIEVNHDLSKAKNDTSS